MSNTEPDLKTENWTSTSLDLSLGANWLGSAPSARTKEFLDVLTESDVRALPYIWEFWAGAHQLPPPGDWRTWVILGGRGAGKTRAGTEWVRSMVEGPGPRDPGKAKAIALVGETFDQAREVMVFGESGILKCSPPDRCPVWHAGRKQLHWPNGAVGYVMSAHDPDQLRGWQFDAMWADELAKWKQASDSWDNLQFCLRLGDNPQACVTTTPRPIQMLRDLLGRESTVQTHAPTEANRAWLAKGFLEEVKARFEGTSKGKQELEGVLLDDIEGALWARELVDASVADALPKMDRIIVAVDPPVSGHNGSDECGIIVAGATYGGAPDTWRAYVLEDATVQGVSPGEWARVVVDAYERHGADRVVAEINQGGALVEANVRTVSPLIPYTAVRASQGKSARAEPIASLYEQRRVSHTRGLTELEQQMCQMTHRGYLGKGSPDRVDALVWALHELISEPSKSYRAPPRCRVL